MSDGQELRQRTSFVLEHCARILLTSQYKPVSRDTVAPLYQPTQLGGANAQRIEPNHSPYSINQLLNRLKTFNSTNWNIPDYSQVDFNELMCAARGWKMLKSWHCSLNDFNRLICDVCGTQVVLPFDPFDTNLDFVTALLKKYAHRVCDGHDPDCIWTRTETPLEGGYYWRMYLYETDLELTSSYLRNTKSFLDSRGYANWLANRMGPSDLETLMFVSATIDWVQKRFYRQDMESIQINLQMQRVLELAACGWSLSVNGDGLDVALVLKCDLCFGTVFILANSIVNDKLQAPNETNSALSEMHPFNDQDQVLNGSIPNQHIHPNTYHKKWCRHMHQMVSADNKTQVSSQYLIQNISQLLKRVDSSGQLMCEY